MAIASEQTPRCSTEEWEYFRWMCSHGMLFEVIDWIKDGKPTLRPEGKKTSAFGTAVEHGNHSLVKVLWKRASQEFDEAARAVSRAPDCGSVEVFRYVIEAGCPLDWICGYDLFGTHDLPLIRAGLDRGVNLTGPDGFADAFLRYSSRPLIRFYLEDHDKRPGLITEGALALAGAIREGRKRAIALLIWAGVDPFTPVPSEYDWDDEPEYPVSRLPYSPEPVAILRMLKLNPNHEEWLFLAESAAGSCPALFGELLTLRRDGWSILRSHRSISVRVFEAFFRGLTENCAWFRCDRPTAEEWCLKLLENGIPFLPEPDSNLNSYRWGAYRGGLHESLARVLEAAWDRGDTNQRERVRCFVDKPKMRAWVKSTAPELYRKLGFISQQRRPAKRIAEAYPAARKRTTERARTPRSIPPGGKVITREVLHKEIWNEPALKVAARYGISSSMLARICTRLGVPRPARGHWAQSETARKRRFKPLKPLEEWMEDQWVIDPKMSSAQKATRAES